MGAMICGRERENSAKLWNVKIFWMTMPMDPLIIRRDQCKKWE